MMNTPNSKHEIIHCDRCNAPFECKANSFTKCECNKVPLTLNETQYISENWEACLCSKCLAELKEEYLAMLDEKKANLLNGIQTGLRDVKEILDGKDTAYNMRDLFEKKQ